MGFEPRASFTDESEELLVYQLINDIWQARFLKSFEFISSSLGLDWYLLIKAAVEQRLVVEINARLIYLCEVWKIGEAIL